MLKKRGSSQVDWAISLALFIFYIAWFFIYVNQAEVQSIPSGSLNDPAWDRVASNITWKVEEYPVFVNSGYGEKNHPILVPFVWGWEKGSFGVKGVYSVLDQDKLIMIEEVNKGINTFALHHSNSPYQNPQFVGDLLVSSTTVSASNIKLHKKDAYIDQIEISNQSAVENLVLEINGKFIESLNYSVKEANSTLHYRRSLDAEFLNISTYVFARNSRVYNWISPNYNANLSHYELTVSAEIYGYEGYFMNNDYFGALDFDTPGCITHNESFVNFYEGNKTALAWALSNISKIKMCYDTDSLDRDEISLEITMPLSKASYMHMIVHQGKFNDSSRFRQQDTVQVGAREGKQGIKKEYAESFLDIPYSQMRSLLGIAGTHEFSLKIVNATDENNVWYAVDEEQPDFNAEVFVKKYDCNLLDQWGDQQACKGVITLW